MLTLQSLTQHILIKHPFCARANLGTALCACCVNLLRMAGGPTPDLRSPCRAQLLSRESDIEVGGRKLGAALEARSCPPGSSCGLRAKDKKDLERMRIAKMGPTKTDPISDCGVQ